MTATEPAWPTTPMLVDDTPTWPVWHHWELPDWLPTAPILPPFPERRLRELTDERTVPPVEPPDPALLARVLDGLRRL